MRKSNQIIQNFFGKINDSYILNVLYILQFIVNIAEHKKRLQEILNVSNPNTSLDEFSAVIQHEIQHYENNLEENPDYLMEEIITGKKINVIKDTPIIWCFLALYWSYSFKNTDQDSILESYNPRVGDIALKFLLYFLKMKQKESRMACVEHKDSFYEDLSARLVRTIDILPVMNAQTSEHLEELYFPNSQIDLALNFLKVQIENPWEAMTLLIITNSKTGKNVIQYRHENENLNFIVQPSRMTKDGAFRDLDKTYNQLMQLWNLDLASSNTKYVSRNTKKSSKKKILPSIITPLEEELIYVDSSIDPEILSSEDQIEQKSKRKVYRRDMKSVSDQDENPSEEQAQEYVIPNAFKQHKTNVAFSSALSKQKMLLKSDYDIPTTQHLKVFISSLSTDENMKIYTGFFILNVALGCKIEDLIYLLQENKVGALQLKTSVITVRVDSSLFAENYNKLLSQSEDKLTFAIPIAMSALIVSFKKVFLEKEFNQVDFLEEYKKFIKSSVKQFSKSISIKHKHLYRYLAQYVLVNGKDVLTSKFATASYTQNDTAKLAYTSSRCDATEHSNLIKNYWNELGLSTIAYNILDINPISSENTSSISPENFTGTSQAVKTNEAYTFFKVLQQNIYDQDNSTDLYFNLVAIYVRYAMSLLAGTRPFYASADFTSYDHESRMWMISEKAQDIASGTRLVPLCDIINTLLNDYQKLVEEKGLKNDFYLIIDSKPVIFSLYIAHKFLQNIHNLGNSEILKTYVENVPLNSGRHLFVRKAIDDLMNVYYISTYLGHYAAGEEHFGIYSTFNVTNYWKEITNITTKIAQECGIKEL